MFEEVSRAIFVGADHSPKWIVENGSRLPAVEDGEVLVRIRLATICGSDLHTVNGKRFELTPLVLGHEAVGEIIQDKGKSLQADDGNKSTTKRPFAPGTRITFSVGASCLACERCRLGLPEKCEVLKKVGHQTLNYKSGFHGCYSTHIVLSPGTHVVPVPDNISDRAVAPVNCALATMINAVQKARTNTRDKSALILGAGLLGLYGCALLRENGYERIYCSDVSHDRLAYVKKFGVEAVHSDRFRDLSFLENSVDTVIEVCGNPSAVSDGFRCLRYGGVFVLVGMVHPDTQLPLTGEQVIRKCITIKGVHNYGPRHLDEALSFLSKTAARYPYEDLLSPNHFSLSQIEHAFAEADKRIFFRSCVAPP